MKINKYVIGFGIVLLALLYRLLPNLPNFSPVTAMFLFAGVAFAKKQGNLWLIIALLYLSDVLLNNTILRSFYPEVQGIVWFSNYMIFTILSYSIIYFVGKTQKQIRAIPIAILAIVSSTIFFLLTNMGAWLFDPLDLYANNLTGLIASWVAGIPFYQTSILADLVFTGVFFGSYVAINRILPKPLNA